MSQKERTINKTLSRPVFETTEDMVTFQKKREIENLFEPAIPPPPTREQEIAYLDWLEGDLRKDKWLCLHFRQRTPGPRRSMFNKLTEVRREQKRKNVINFLIGAVLGYPFGILLARRMTHYSGGVPVIIQPVWLPQNHLRHPMHKTARNFYFSLFMVCFTTGMLYRTYKLKDSKIMVDENWNRPDLKSVLPFQQDAATQDGKNKDLYEAHHTSTSYWNPVIKAGNKTSALYRFLFPKTSNWEVRHDPLSDNQLRYKGDGFFTNHIDRSTHTWNP